ncbi:MAG: hypothetical protein K0S12_860 [Bacteroidetes bacterium]|jgi:hypothetical protein|nr:hypothetical protein [Bacteroidota bacterium]
MKKLLTFIICLFCFFSCIKKKALRYDPDLVGTWIGTEGDELNYWIKVYSDGSATYRSIERGEEKKVEGKIKYSVFELKMWIHETKFKVKEWLTKDMKGVYVTSGKDYETLQDKQFQVDRRMVLKTTLFNDFRTITFYRIVE